MRNPSSSSSSAGAEIRRRARSARTPIGVAVFFWLIAGAAQAAEPPANPSPVPVLNLTNSGFAGGELQDSDQPDLLRWQSPLFAAPFDFDLNRVNAVHWPPPAKLPRPSGEYCFELAGGDVLFGSLIELGEKDLVLEVPRFGRLHVQRTSVQRIYRWRDGADLIYVGPNGLTGWHEADARKGWREESGQLVTNQDGAKIQGDLGLPPRAAVEFEISWLHKPDFVFALGVGNDEKTIQHAFRFEVWEGELVVHRETDNEADVASLREVGSGPGRAHFLAYIDQEKGRLLVFSPDGKPLADLKVTEPKPKALTGLSLANVRGDVRLERLRIGRWNGEAPRESKGDSARIHLADGSIVYGQVSRFDPTSKEYVVKGEKEESRIAENRVASVLLSSPKESPSRTIRAVYEDGARLSGTLVKVLKGEVWLTVPGIEESPRLPLAGMRSLVVLRHDATAADVGDLTGVLEMDGLKLRGRLIDGREQAGASCLAWKPLGSSTASPLRPGTSGKIVYREPPPIPRPVPAHSGMVIRQLQPQRVGVIQGFLNGLSGAQPEQPAAPASRRALHLRTGDIIPCEVAKIDETGVTFKTSLSDSTFVSHDKVKAVELAPEPAVNTVRLNKAKRDRLLTLPRMQKESPPTQLIRSKNGDYLRGRVLAMNDRILQVEVRLETKDLPRDRVARIIWLHPDEVDPAKTPGKAPEAGAATRVQALRRDGIRLTFFPERMAAGELSGKSDVLGACRVPMSDVDQLLIGGAIEQAAAQLAYQQWKLHNAVEPKVSQDDGGSSASGGPSGTESAMVGKPAPDFKLDLLDGKPFHLAESKGKVVVLDFWATWCGPCMQTMPQVEKVMEEFKEKDVQLIAVNLQEQPKQISSILERHKMHVTVALDRDGAVAEKYAANAIPQTVIVDRDGKVARLFVGGGPHFDDQLREALKTVLSGDKPKEPAKSP